MTDKNEETTATDRLVERWTAILTGVIITLMVTVIVVTAAAAMWLAIRALT